VASWVSCTSTCNEKTDAVWAPATQRLLSICCCRACAAQWRSAGLHPDRTRALIRDATWPASPAATWPGPRTACPPTCGPRWLAARQHATDRLRAEVAGRDRPAGEDPAARQPRSVGDGSATGPDAGRGRGRGLRGRPVLATEPGQCRPGVHRPAALPPGVDVGAYVTAVAAAPVTDIGGYVRAPRRRGCERAASVPPGPGRPGPARRPAGRGRGGAQRLRSDRAGLFRVALPDRGPGDREQQRDQHDALQHLLDPHPHRV